MRARLFLTLLCIALAAGCSKGGTDPKSKQSPAIPVVTAPVEQRSLPLVLRAVGTVESTGSVNIQSRVDGQIVRVFVRDGDEVRAGQPLLQIDPAPFEIQLRLAQATLAGNEARLQNAKAKAEHGRRLIEQHYISTDEYTQLKTDLDAAAAVVEQDRAAVDNAKLQLSYARIVAPVAGKIGHITQKVGNTVHVTAQTVLTTLNVLDPIEVSFAVPEQQLGTVRGALAAARPPVQASVDGAEGKTVQLTGQLTFVDNAADPTTGTIRLRASFDNRARSFWPGQLVTVALHLAENSQNTVAPLVAVAQGPNGSYVYVVKDSTAEQRPVRIERTSENWAILSGVQAGEHVVVDGQSRLRPDAPVRVVQPPTKPAA